MNINDYFYSVITEYSRRSGFEQADFYEIPEALRIDEMLFCYRKVFQINDEQVLPLDSHLLDEYKENGKFPDVYLFIYCLKNDLNNVYLLVSHPDSQKYVSQKLTRSTVLISTWDVIKITIDTMIKELVMMFDEKKATLFCFKEPE